MPGTLGNKNAVENRGGRPTKFKPEYSEELIKFFSGTPYRKEVVEDVKKYHVDGGIKEHLTKYKVMPNKIPTLFGFAKSIGVRYVTVADWAKKGEEIAERRKREEETVVDSATITSSHGVSPELDEKEKKAREVEDGLVEFSSFYKEARELQKEFIISVGMSGSAPAPFAIFTAKNITDMRDKTETDITSQGDRIGTITYLIPNEKGDSEHNDKTEQDATQSV